MAINFDSYLKEAIKKDNSVKTAPETTTIDWDKYYTSAREKDSKSGLKTTLPTTPKFNVPSILNASPNARTAQEDAIAKAFETGDNEFLLNLAQQNTPGSQINPVQLKPQGLNLGESLVYGAGKTAEGLTGAANTIVYGPGQLLYSGLGALTGLFGKNSVSDYFYKLAGKNAEGDLFGEKAISEGLEKEYGDKLSDADRSAGNIVKSGSELLGTVAAGNAIGAVSGAGALSNTSNLASKAIFGTSAFRSGVQEALSEGANIEDASAYGALSATLSLAVESIAEGIPGLDNANSLTSKLLGKLKSTPQALKTLAGIVGEGGEEALEAAISPYLQRITYNPEAEAATLDELTQAFASGAILSGIMQGGNIVAGKIADASTAAQPQNTATQTATSQPSSYTAPQTQTATVPQIKTPFPQTGLQAPQTQQNIAPTVTRTQAENKPTVAQDVPWAEIEMGARQQSPTNSVGAASLDSFSDYSKLQRQAKAFFPEGENPAPTRSVQVPTTDFENKNISKTIATVMEAKATPDAAVPDIEQATADGKFSFLPITDNVSKSKANKTITQKGYQNALRDWTVDVRSGKVNKDNIALGAQLYNQAVNAGDTKAAIDILVDYVANVRSAAQSLQGSRILKQLTPEGQLYSIQKEVSNLNEQLKDAQKVAGDIKINSALADAFLKANTDETRQKALDEIYQDVANQIKTDWVTKWNAWRYLAMLGNPRTHVRNIVGNIGFMPARAIKNILGAAIEKAAGIQDRTKAILTPIDTPLIKLAWKDYPLIAKTIMETGKFSDAKSEIRDRQTIFKFKPLEFARKSNTSLMEIEDVLPAKIAYTTSLAGYLKANGITAEQWDNLPADKKDAARSYAIREAQRATYRDHNAFSDYVARLGKNYQGDNKIGKAADVAVEALLPFKRTPANILTRSVEYSPLGLIRGLKQAFVDVQKGEVTAAEAIDNIAAGLTGSGIMALGILLRSMGFIVGGRDKEEKALDGITGRQPYALEVGNTSITLDWLAPMSLPFFVGVELFDTATDESENGVTFSDILDSVSSITEPMLEMSMLQGIDDVLQSVAYSDNRIQGVVATMAVNYLSQGLPTLFGQIERIAEGQRETTVANDQSGLPTSLQYILGQAANKIPFVEFQQQPYIDALGQTQDSGSIANRVFNNMFNPSYTSNISTNMVVKELERLYQSNALNRIPERPGRSFSYGGEKYSLTGEEYTTFAKTQGQKTLELMTKTMNGEEYKKASDIKKGEMLSELMTEAQSYARQTIVEGRGEMYLDTKGREKVQLFVDTSGITEKQAYEVYKALDSLETKGSTNEGKVDRVSTILKQQGISQEQKAKLIGTLFSTSAKDSLLPDLNHSDHLIALYVETEDSEVISMGVPDKFSFRPKNATKSTEYILTDKEKELFRKEYAKYFNNYVTKLSTAAQIKKIRDDAYEFAKAAVVKNRRG